MAMTLITTNTSSGAATSDFTSSIDNTYKLYIFKFYDVNPATDTADFTFNGSDDASSHSYDIIKTTTYFTFYHNEDDSNYNLAYQAARDLAQSTAFQLLTDSQGSGGDESSAGELFLFNPSNTTYVKHFYARDNAYYSGDISRQNYIAGYFNTTAAITALQFKMSTGNMDAVIKMYGVG